MDNQSVTMSPHIRSSYAAYSNANTFGDPRGVQGFRVIESVLIIKSV